MLTAAFVGWIVGVVLAPLLPADPSPFFGVTPALLIAFVLAVLSSVAVALLHAWLSISVRADQIISGTIINILAAGLTAYLYTIVSAGSPESAGYFPPWVPPTPADRPPGRSAGSSAMFLNQGPIAISVICHRHRVPDLAVPVALGPPVTGRRRAPEGGRDRRHRRHPAALPERPVRRRPRRAGRRLPVDGGQQLVPGRDDRRARVHRPGGHDRRPLDAGRGVRRRPAVLVLAGARPDHQVRPAERRARRRACSRSRASSTTRCRTS